MAFKNGYIIGSTHTHARKHTKHRGHPLLNTNTRVHTGTHSAGGLPLFPPQGHEPASWFPTNQGAPKQPSTANPYPGLQWITGKHKQLPCTLIRTLMVHTHSMQVYTHLQLHTQTQTAHRYLMLQLWQYFKVKNSPLRL